MFSLFLITLKIPRKGTSSDIITNHYIYSCGSCGNVGKRAVKCFKPVSTCSLPLLSSAFCIFTSVPGLKYTTVSLSRARQPGP